MSKYIGPVCRLCRREGEKLYLKGARCLSPKCAIEKRNFPPGQHGKEGQFRRNRSSDYLMQLREKQKARRVYGVLEAQFQRYYKQALKSRGVTGQVLLQMLERRLDNVVYRMGFAANRAQARNLVTHGHFNVNGRRTDVPSLLINPGDTIEVRPGSQRRNYFQTLRQEGSQKRTNTPGWLNADIGGLSGQVQRLPAREEIDANLNEQLIVEYYSR
jgi:small subunit ribosomal protein S4